MTRHKWMLATAVTLGLLIFIGMSQTTEPVAVQKTKGQADAHAGHNHSAQAAENDHAEHPLVAPATEDPHAGHDHGVSEPLQLTVAQLDQMQVTTAIAGPGTVDIQVTRSTQDRFSR